jgi:invasion protein IalB
MPAQKIITQWRILQPIHFVLGLLILLTATLLLWQHYGMNLYLRFDPNNFTKVSANDDRDNGQGKRDNGQGKSIGQLSHTPNYWRLNCQLKEGHRSPYCSIDLDLKNLPAQLLSTSRATGRKTTPVPINARLALSNPPKQ